MRHNVEYVKSPGPPVLIRHGRAQATAAAELNPAEIASKARRSNKF